MDQVKYSLIAFVAVDFSFGCFNGRSHLDIRPIIREGIEIP
jgi:hypothetical protein